MRTTRAQFKYALKLVEKQEDTARADSLARDLYDNDVDSFSKAVHKMNSCNSVQANVIGGITGFKDSRIQINLFATTNTLSYAINKQVID